MQSLEYLYQTFFPPPITTFALEGVFNATPCIHNFPFAPLTGTDRPGVEGQA